MSTSVTSASSTKDYRDDFFIQENVSSSLDAAQSKPYGTKEVEQDLNEMNGPSGRAKEGQISSGAHTQAERDPLYPDLHMSASYAWFPVFP